MVASKYQSIVNHSSCCCRNFYCLQAELSALTSKRSQADSHLTDVQARLDSTEGELSNTQSKLKTAESDLTSTQSRLKKAEAMLAEAKKELQAAERTSKDSVSSCKKTLEKVSSATIAGSVGFVTERKLV